MTEFQHALLGGLILIISWYAFFSKMLYSDKDKDAWEEMKKLFSDE